MTGTFEAEIKRMLEQELICPTIVPGLAHGTVHFCVDYQKLNEVTRKDAYPLPQIEGCFDCLGRSTWFCTLNLQNNFPSWGT